MKIKFSLLFILLLPVFGINCTNEIRTQLISDLPSYTEDAVIIKPEAAIFIFKIDPKSSWEWYQKKTPVNQMEYGWSAIFKFDDVQYGCGYKLFKHPHAKPNSGSFNQLMKAGQFDVWRMNIASKKHIEGNLYALTGSSQPIEYARIDNVISSNSLGIKLKEKEVVEKFLNFRPETVTFQHKTPGKASSRKSIKVDYQLEG